MDDFALTRVWLLAVPASIGSFIFGYNIGLGANGPPEDVGAFPPLFHVSMPLGAVFGSVASGLPAERLGRRGSLLLFDCIILVSVGLAIVASLDRFVTQEKYGVSSGNTNSSTTS